MVGLAMPVTEAKKMAEMSAAVMPARSRARVTAISPSSTAALIHAEVDAAVGVESVQDAGFFELPFPAFGEGLCDLGLRIAIGWVGRAD
jgi:hypothetical protein